MLRMFAMAALALLVASCGKPNDEATQFALAVQKGDICTVCGMEIDNQPGPRAEAYLAGKPVKFGSTRDFMGFVTQPDIVHQLGRLYVQDVARIDWQHPTGDPHSFVDARTAYYVGWQNLAGEMGPTFASFTRKSDAEAFRRSHGGALLRFEQITPDLVAQLSNRCPGLAGAFASFAASCTRIR